MSIARFWLTCLLLLQVVASAARPSADSLRFIQADRVALSLGKETNFVSLSEKIADAFPDDLNRTRVIFRWITDNIQFDYRFVNRGDEIAKPECEQGQDCAGIMRDWETNFLKKIMKSRKATAEGYARLFKKLCDLLYIPCETINGYARTKPYQIGNNMSPNHYWNAVYLDTAWLYADLTWAAGFCEEDEEGRLTKYVKSLQEYYWLQPLETFSRNHYPKKGFQVEKMSLTREQFFNKPFYFSADVLKNLTEIIPSTGVLKCKKGDSLEFRFKYAKEIRQIQVNSNLYRNPPVMIRQQVRGKYKWVRDEWAERKQVYVSFKRSDDTYTFSVPVTQESLYYLELVFDGQTAIRYRVRVE